jgi:Flp pilus assembly protein TadD
LVAGGCEREHLDRGDLLLDRGKPGEAIAAWQSALDERPEDTDLLIRIATAQSRLQHLDEAEKTMLRAVELAPRSPKVRQNLGLVYFKQKRFDDALDAFERVVALQESYPEACYYIGLIHEMRGDERAAERYYVRAVNVGPSRAWDNLALMKQRQREAGALPPRPERGGVLAVSAVLLALAALCYGLRRYIERRETPPGWADGADEF